MAIAWHSFETLSRPSHHGKYESLHCPRMPHTRSSQWPLLSCSPWLAQSSTSRQAKDIDLDVNFAEPRSCRLILQHCDPPNNLDSLTAWPQYFTMLNHLTNFTQQKKSMSIVQLFNPRSSSQLPDQWNLGNGTWPWQVGPVFTASKHEIGKEEDFQWLSLLFPYIRGSDLKTGRVAADRSFKALNFIHVKEGKERMLFLIFLSLHWALGHVKNMQNHANR